jgi:uncharacterized protein (DUF1786 family)
MHKLLLIDIGAGTMDMLYIDLNAGLHYKVVAKSPVAAMTETVARCQGNLLIDGVEMGGGRFSQSLKTHARHFRAVMTESASATVHHNPAIVRASGIEIIDDAAADLFRHDSSFTTIESGDLNIERIDQLIESLGVSAEFDAVGICAQDHGVPPDGVSHLDFRHNIFEAALNQQPQPEALLYRSDRIPPVFSRLNAIAQTARRLPTRSIYVMDSGMAAVLGASLDPRAHDKHRIVVIDAATSHTVCAALECGRLAGFFEYHTQDMTPHRLAQLVPALTDGKIDHDRILAAGGHGAYLRSAFGYQNTQLVIMTGPKRNRFDSSDLPLVYGAPLGDNMMTGTAGLLEAIRRRKGLKALPPIW